MKKSIIVIILLGIPITAFGACKETGTVYTARKPGYYLSSGGCLCCPSSGGIYGTTPDKNTGDITSCYLPAGTGNSDTTSKSEYTSNCHYSN